LAVNSNPTKEATPVADERDEYRRDQQYLAAEREDQRKQAMRCGEYGGDPGYDDDVEDHDEGIQATEQDDPEDEVPIVVFLDSKASKPRSKPKPKAKKVAKGKPKPKKPMKKGSAKKKSKKR